MAKMGLERIIKPALLLSLPITIVTILTGVIQAFLFAYYDAAQVGSDTNNLVSEMERYVDMELFNVPGAPGIHDTRLPPFHIIKLHSIDWWHKLNITKPDEHIDKWAGINHMGELDILMRDLNCHGDSPTHHWVYVTKWPFPSYDLWDSAFDRLLQHHYRYPPAHNATFNYVDCTSSPFLCAMWFVKPPTLLHFTTAVLEEPKKEHPSGFPAEFEKLHYSGVEATDDLFPITVRVTQLPLDESLPGPIGGIFPDHFEQFLRFTGKEFAYEMMNKYDPILLMTDRFYDWHEDLAERWRSLKYFNKVGRWIQTHAGPLEQPLTDLAQITFTLFSHIFSAAFSVSMSAAKAYNWYFGVPNPNMPPGFPDNQPKENINLFGMMYKDFMKEVEEAEEVFERESIFLKPGALGFSGTMNFRGQETTAPTLPLTT